MTNISSLIFRIELWNKSVEYKLLSLGIAQNCSEDEIFGHVMLLHKIYLLEFFCPLMHTCLFLIN